MRVSLPDDTPLAIGMTVEVNIVVRVAEATLLVPAGVVEDGASSWWRMGWHRRAVALGIQGATQVEVTGGLAEGRGGDRGADLVDGARVRVESGR